MDTAPVRRSVRSLLGLTLLGTDTPILMTAALVYRHEDPYAVEAVFDLDEGETVRWLFSRDLLDEGLVHAVGHGDVQVAPSHDPLGQATILLQLSSPNGRAVLEAYADDVLAFLEQSYALVPPGTEPEHLDLDGVLARLLHQDVSDR